MNEETLFHLALDMPPDERVAFLDEACRGDLALCSRVQLLLTAHDNPGSFLVRPAVDLSNTEESPTRHGQEGRTEPVVGPGTQIGPYRLLRLIGEGGMGAVFMAEQQAPVRRRVALKLIKPGMEAQHVIARFEAERQTLAMMDHPNIARVLDAGTTAGGLGGGRPYFVMELVEGVPITRYCDEKRLNPRERLELFVGVCQAVQHAHQKGIIHRDLKPGNVLVATYDGVPVPKVIDFGVAKATGPRLTEHTSLTEFGTLVGTLEYMSPEQAQIEHPDVDTRSDIYSLGVLLYELLTGTTPFDRKRFKEVALLEGLRLIREEEPPRPSLRLGSTEELPAVAARRSLEPRRLVTGVRGDLDWIVMKALDKERNRRYDTANDLARDVQRYLDDKPVRACPPSAWYRVHKFLRRNRRALLTTVLFLLAVTTVAGNLGWVAHDRNLRRKAAQSGAEVELDRVALLHGQRNWAEALVALRRAEAWLNSADLDPALGQKAQQWRLDLELLTQLEDIRLLRSASGGKELDPTRADAAYRNAFRSYGLDMEHASPTRLAERIKDSVCREQLLEALQDWALGAAQHGLSDWKRLLKVARLAGTGRWRDDLLDARLRQDQAALTRLARSKEATDQSPVTTLLLVRALNQVKEGRLAEQVCRRALARHPGDPWLNLELAQLLSAGGNRQEALVYWRAFLAVRQRSATAHASFGYALYAMGRLADAETAVTESLRLDPQFPGAYCLLASIRMVEGKLPQAEVALRKATDLDSSSCIAHYNLAVVLAQQGKVSEAERFMAQACRIRPGFAWAYWNFGVILVGRGHPRQAVAHFRKAADLQPDHAEYHRHLAEALKRSGQFVASRNVYHRWYERARRQSRGAGATALQAGQWLRTADRLVWLDSRLLAILRGQGQPTSPADGLALTEVATLRGFNVAAVRLSEEAFAAAPALADEIHSHRYNAACYAALAATSREGDAAGLDDEARARMRRLALGWLRDELNASRGLLDREGSRSSRIVAQRLQHWMNDPDLDALRGKHLVRLLMPERHEWQELWQEVEEVRSRAARPLGA
jgi:serine/threonine protein kinase/Flp pilus assembly protein TadD